MIISKDAEKAFDKIQHHFMLKIISKTGIEGTFYNKIKEIGEKHNTIWNLNGGKLEAFTL